jgi:hypothetical protein
MPRPARSAHRFHKSAKYQRISGVNGLIGRRAAVSGFPESVKVQRNFPRSTACW